MGYQWQGYAFNDQAANATGTVLELPTGDYGYNISISNTGTSDVFVRPNATVAELTTAIDYAVKVPAGGVFNFFYEADYNVRKLSSLAIKTGTGDTTTLDVVFT